MAVRRHPASKIALLLGFLAIVGLAGLGPMQASTTEQVVVDGRTGLAINGFDPVAYFTEGKPQPGRGEHEYTFAGATWRFRNEGNRGAFIDHPDIYAPQFGGYDPIGLGRGIPLPGDPRLWLVRGQRLYLFYTADNRNAFLDDPERNVAAAERRWPAVRNTLSP